MPFLKVDVERVRVAWEDSAVEPLEVPGPVMAVEEELGYGRKAVVIHLPQTWPHGCFCHNCGWVYPCKIASWGMKLLRARGWEVTDAIDLIEAVTSGEQPL